MSLIDDIRNAYKNEQGFSPRDYPGVKCLVNGSIVGQGRWTTFYSYIYERGGEFVEVVESQGSTEMQDGDYEDPEIFPVTPVEKTIIDYVRID